jgi:hypothetical protein
MSPVATRGPEPIGLIGIDCATQPARIGLALGRYLDGAVWVEEVCRGNARADYPAILAGWMDDRDRTPTLLALDVPLGWPAGMCSDLRRHRAGSRIARPADELFYRQTDRNTLDRLGIRPFAIGADRIARTARETLGQIETIRRTDRPIPLARDPAVRSTSMIEVYPAATLKAVGIGKVGTRGGSSVHRAAVAEQFGGFGAGLEKAFIDGRMSDHEIDAVVCLLAAQHFLAGHAIAPQPDERALAEREGWIWVHS